MYSMRLCWTGEIFKKDCVYKKATKFLRTEGRIFNISVEKNDRDSFAIVRFADKKTAKEFRKCLGVLETLHSDAQDFVKLSCEAWDALIGYWNTHRTADIPMLEPIQELKRELKKDEVYVYEAPPKAQCVVL